MSGRGYLWCARAGRMGGSPKPHIQNTERASCQVASQQRWEAVWKLLPASPHHKPRVSVTYQLDEQHLQPESSAEAGQLNSAGHCIDEMIKRCYLNMFFSLNNDYVKCDQCESCTRVICSFSILNSWFENHTNFLPDDYQTHGCMAALTLSSHFNHSCAICAISLIFTMIHNLRNRKEVQAAVETFHAQNYQNYFILSF